MGCRASTSVRYPESVAASCRGAPTPRTEISPLEEAAFAARQCVCEAALSDFCSKQQIPMLQHPPVIGVALSGGGWRALASSAAFLDALSEAGLLDAVTYTAGVSGGGWCLFNYCLGCQYNPIHATNENPWIVGGATL